MSTDDVVGLSVDAGLATITLRRAGASNALDRAVKEQLLAAVEKVAADDGVRALLLQAEGKNFCVGQDLAEHVAGLEADAAHAMDTVAEHLAKTLGDRFAPPALLREKVANGELGRKTGQGFFTWS